MKRFTFSLHLIGLGDDVDEAWRDALEATCLDNDAPPLEYTIEEEDEDECI